MKKYEYKVTNFEANVSSSSDNVAAEVSGQVESLFEDYAAEGWELLGQYKFMVNYDAGCLGNILANFKQKKFKYLNYQNIINLSKIKNQL